MAAIAEIARSTSTPPQERWNWGQRKATVQQCLKQGLTAHQIVDSLRLKPHELFKLREQGFEMPFLHRPTKENEELAIALQTPGEHDQLEAALAKVNYWAYQVFSQGENPLLISVAKAASESGLRFAPRQTRIIAQVLERRGIATREIRATNKKTIRCFATQQIHKGREVLTTDNELAAFRLNYLGHILRSKKTAEKTQRASIDRATSPQNNGAVWITSPAGLIFENETALPRMKPNGLATAALAIEETPAIEWKEIEAEVVKRAQAGDHEAFGAIFNQYQRQIYIYIHRLLSNTEDAAELTQDTFLKAYQALPRTSHDLQVRPWLYQIATNVCLDALRHRKIIHWQPWETFISRFHPSQVSNEDPEQDVLNKENQEEVQLIFSRLYPKYRTCLTLREYEGFSYDEIAEALHTTRPAVKSLLSRARKEFRQVYARAERKPELIAR